MGSGAVTCERCGHAANTPPNASLAHHQNTATCRTITVRRAMARRGLFRLHELGADLDDAAKFDQRMRSLISLAKYGGFKVRRLETSWWYPTKASRDANRPEVRTEPWITADCWYLLWLTLRWKRDDRRSVMKLYQTTAGRAVRAAIDFRDEGLLRTLVDANRPVRRGKEAR